MVTPSVRAFVGGLAALWVAGFSCAQSTDGSVGGAGGTAGSVGGGVADDDGASSVGGGGSLSAGGAGGAGGAPDTCGNGTIEPPETCDGADLGGKKCTSFGLSPGVLSCNQTCQLVVSGCGAPENCTNGTDDDADGDIDCLDSECAALPECLDSCEGSLEVALPIVEFKSTLGRPDTYQPTCSTTSGSELVYQVTTVDAGMLGISVSQFYGDFTVAVTRACGDDTSEIACVSAVSNRYFNENMQVPVDAGATYHVVIDAVAPERSGIFGVQMFMVGGNEASCIDLLDADVDGLLDCNDPDCQSTSTCQNGVGALGSPCAQAGACSSAHDDPFCLPSVFGFEDGYCTEFCDLTANDCPGDGQCYDYGLGASGVCLDGCSDGSDCRSGYACVDLGLPNKVCYIAPETDCDNFEDEDFDQLTDCDDPDCKSTQACIAGARAYSEPCTQNSDCGSVAGEDPLCLTDTPFFFSGGYCSEFCNVATADCGPDGLCRDWFHLDGTTGQCFKRCQTSNDCGGDTQCVNHGFGKHCNL